MYQQAANRELSSVVSTLIIRPFLQEIFYFLGQALFRPNQFGLRQKL